MLRSSKENNLLFKHRIELLYDILDRREYDWREANTTSNYPLLSWADYRFLCFNNVPELPSMKQYEDYRLWCFMNGFMPYGGESYHEPELTYLLAKKQFEEELKAADREFYEELSRMLDE